MTDEEKQIEHIPTNRTKEETENTPLPAIDYDSTKVQVKLSDIHARGVFAKQDIAMKEAIEIFPLTPSSFRTKYQGDVQVLAYGFINHTCPCEECKKHGYLIYLSSGYGNMYNHQPNPNAILDLDFKNLYGTIKAIKEIKKGEEIVISYASTFLFQEGMVLNHENNPRD